jgi:PAS domain S-box-containing protein
MPRWRGLLGAAAVGICIAFGAPAEEADRRVLVLYPYTDVFPSTTIIGEAVRKRLAERSVAKVETYAEFLDLNRFAGEANEDRVAGYLAAKYAGMRFDAVVAMGPNALRFIGEHRASIAPGVPVAYALVSPQTLSRLDLAGSYSGILLQLDLSRTMELASRLQPEARRVVVIAGAAEVDRRWEQTARIQLAGYVSREVRFLVGLPHRELLEEVSRLPRDTIVLLTLVMQDGNGRTFVPREVAKEIAAASAAPVYTPYDFIGQGIVGGYMDTFESVGVQLGDLVLEILTSGTAVPPGPRASRSAFRVDWRQMQRWDLPAANLPDDTIVLFREPSLWEEHRDVMLVLLAAFTLQTGIVVVLLLQVRRRRKAERSLLQSEERMAYVAASANVGLWQYDHLKGTLWATGHCRSMFGIPTSAELSADSFLQAVHPADQRAMRKWMRSVVDSPTPAVGEFRVPQPGGDVAWYLAQGQARLDDRGGPVSASGTFSDITTRKKAESEANAQRRALAHTARVATLGELSGAIAHEINQPLTAILSNAQAARRMLAGKSPDLEEIGAALDDIIAENSRADEVIRRLRGMLRKEEGTIEPLALNDLVQPVLRLLHSELVNRQISVNLELADQLPQVAGDAIQLQQVLINLLTNAMDAITSPGAFQRTIVIATRRSQPDRVEAIITDRGPGLPAGREARMFEPFYTTKQNGLGLGLSICASIVRAHGGVLRLANDADGGARASVTLPVLPAVTSMAAAE